MRNSKNDNMRLVGFEYGPTKKRLLDFIDEPFQPEFIIATITKDEDLPLMLPHGLLWKDLNMLIHPGRPHTPVFRFPGDPQGYFGKKDTMFYIRSFFNNEKMPLYMHLWPSAMEKTVPTKNDSKEIKEIRFELLTNGTRLLG